MPTKSSSKKTRSRLHVRRSGSVTVTQGDGNGATSVGTISGASGAASDIKGAKAKVHVHRSGSISVSQFAGGSSTRGAEAAAAVRVSAQQSAPRTAGSHAEHSHGDAHAHGDAPWMIGVDETRSSERRYVICPLVSLDPSPRRGNTPFSPVSALTRFEIFSGSYYGMYRQSESQAIRSRHRTNSTVDRRLLTPMPGSDMEQLYKVHEAEHTTSKDGWHVHRLPKQKR